MRVSDYVIERLVLERIKRIYSITGRGSLFLNDAVAKNPGITNIATHHEQAAGFAAVGDSQFTEELSACLVSTGCASTNTITAVLSAWQDGNPVIFLSGQNFLQQTTTFSGISLRTYGQQETNIIDLVRPITKFSKMITNVQEVQISLERAICEAKSGRKGPVWIDIPIDIQNMQFEPTPIEVLQTTVGQGKDSILDEQILAFQEMLRLSERPLFLIGHGVAASKSVDKLIKIIDQTNTPLVYTPSSVDVIGSKTKNSIGAVGVMGCSRAANIAVQSCDLLIVLGSRLNSMITGDDFNDFARNAKMVIVDIDEIEHSKVMPEISLFLNVDVGDLLSVEKLWVDLTPSEEWVEHCLQNKEFFSKPEEEFSRTEKVDLYSFSAALSKCLPRESSVVTDSGLIELILPSNIAFGIGQRCIHPASQGAMGFALPASIGVQMASGGFVVAIIGDGSIMMNLQELQTISYNKLPIKIFVVNNNVYAVIRKRQNELFRNRTIGTDSTNGVDCPDFSKIALAFNLQYVKIENANDLENSILNVFDLPGSVLCEVMGFEDQGYVQMGVGRSKDGKLVRLPLEDQVPRLTEEVLNAARTSWK